MGLKKQMKTEVKKMILIIAEKPSLGRNIAAGIEEAVGNGAHLAKKSVIRSFILRLKKLPQMPQ